MLLYHFPLTSSSATATIVNKGLKDDYTISGDNNFSSGGKLSSYAKDMGENKFYLSIPNFSLDYTLCFRAKATSNILLVSVGYTPFEITADNTWHDYVICDKKVYKDGLFLTNYNYSAGIVAFGDSEDSCQGLIQDIRIYDYALSQAEINEYSRALVVHYPLNGNVLNSNVIKDCSGFGNDAVLHSGFQDMKFSSDTPRYTKCCRDEVMNENFKYEVENFYPTYCFSFSLWVKFKSNTSQVGAINIFRYNKNGIYWNGANNTLYGYIEATTTSGICVSGLNDDKWHHVVLTFEYKNSTIIANAYNDGVLHRTNTSNYSPVHTSQLLSFSRYVQADVKWSISDFRVYATALSAEDIKNLYNSPISVSNQHQTMAFELKENSLYPSKYWRTPMYNEMNYILTQRTNAANLRTLGRVEISSGVYRNGCFLLPDDWSLPSGISMTITTENYFTNTYTLTQFKIIEEAGGIFIPSADRRNGANMQINGIFIIWLATSYNVNNSYCLQYNGVSKIITFSTFQRYYGMAVRLCHTAQGKNTFSTSSSTFIKLAKSNLQYHCTQHIWRFAEHSYDYIGADNANISDSYNGWIDLFGYGTSGVNYSPTLHTTNNSDYASGDIANTDNDWGVNEIQSYDYNVKNFALNKNGIVQHNELREYDLLPQEYQLVEYLESTGTQYIDTGYIPLKADTIKTIYGYVAKAENQCFGCIQITPVLNRCHTNTIYNGSQIALLCKDEGTNFYIAVDSTSRFLTFTWKQDSVNISDEQTAQNECTYPNLSFFLFARNTNGSASNYTTCKCKKFSVDGKINMYPCYRKSDNKPGMYDIIRHKFFTNQGTGADFLVGNDIQKINGIYKDKILTNELIEQ